MHRRQPGRAPRDVSPEAGLARSVLGGYLRVRAGQPVVVESWSHAIPWARALVVEARRRGATPVLAVEDEDGFFRSLLAGGAVPSAPSLLTPPGGAYVYLGGPEAFPRLLGLPFPDLGRAIERHGGAWTEAARSARLRGARLEIAAVTPTAAARFGVSLDAWRDEVLAASGVPPYRLGRAAIRSLRRLGRARTVLVRHSNGTRLTLGIRRGGWTEESGRPARTVHRADPVWTSVPTGKLTLALRPRLAHGRWESNRPTFERFSESARIVGARFEFLGGALADASFDRGGEDLAGAARRGRPGPLELTGLSVGLNPEVRRAPEIGDLALGTLGLRFRLVQRSARARRSARPVTFLLDGAEVDLDGRPWLVGGRELRSRA